MNTNKTFTNTMPWTNTQVRNNPFPLERWSLFETLQAAEEYALSNVVAYEGQLVAVTDGGIQKVYVLDSTMDNGLRQLAAGDDASQILSALNREISARISADEYLSGVLSTEAEDRLSNVADLNNAISTEIENRISSYEYLSTNLSISIEDGGTPALSNVLKTYVVKQGTREVGTIDIPKDFLVKSAEVKTVTEADVPYAGAQVGDKYIDLEINAKTGSTEDGHIYIPIKDFFVPYKAGVTNTISVDIGDDNTISAVVRASSITSAELADNAVLSSKIADGQVTTSKIDDLAVTSSKIADSAVISSKIADDAVLSSKIADGQVVESKIADSAVTEDKIADDAVTNSKIADAAVGTAELSSQAVTTEKIADDAVVSSKILDGNVTTSKIADSAVISNKIADDAVTNSKIADGAVGTAELSSQAVTTEKIALSAVTTEKIADDAVTNAKIEDGAVTTDKIADNAVDSSKLSAQAVTTNKIAEGAVLSSKIGDGQVTESKIADSAVTEEKIADQAVTNEKLGLSSVTMDNLSSDVLDYIETQTSDAKAYVDGKISSMSSDWEGDASKTVVSVAQRDGKVTLSAVSIAISSSQVVDLGDVVGNYVPLSVASSSASSSDKLQTASEVSSIAQDYALSGIQSLDVETISIGVSKTLASLGQVDGKISAEAVSIQIDESQVNGLTNDLTSITSDIDALSSSKLSKTEFSDLSNLIGLSAASSTNHIVTNDDIADLAGAMHFKGVVVKTLGETDLEAIARYYADQSMTPASGDVVMIQDSTLEYVYNGTQWMQLGDETLYVTKAEYDLKLSAVDDAINNKIAIDGLSAQTLSVIHIDADSFYEKVRTSAILSNELYIVSSNYINAYGHQVKNVADPSLSSDAATKNYVDAQVQGLAQNALTGVVLNGVAFDVVDNVASLSITEISCGDANA